MQTEKLSDEKLALLSQSGDKTATDQLLKRYKNMVLSVARRFFLSGGETEDLVQEGMCGLYSAIQGYAEGKSSFASYAARCIRNRIIDAVKATGGAKHSALNNFLPISRNLSSFEFKVTVMYMDGLTMAEMSSATGKPVKSIDNALQRAKRKLSGLF